MVITMAVGQKTGSGEGFCYGDTMAVEQKTGGGEAKHGFEVDGFLPW